MNTPARQTPPPQPTAVATLLPDEDTVVLLRRELVSDADQHTLSRFADDSWYLNEAIFEENATAMRLNFSTIPRPLRAAAKHYYWQLINTDVPVALTRAGVGRYSIGTVFGSFGAFREFTLWLHRHRVAEFSQVTAAMLDDYLLDLSDSDLTLERKFRRLTEVRRLWSYRSVLPPHLRLPVLPPWGGDTTRELLGRARPMRENLTKRIGEQTMQSLLSWSLRFVEDFAPDILAAHAGFRILKGRSIPERRRSGTATRVPNGQVEQRLNAYLDRLRRHGGALPGRIGSDGTVEINWHHIGLILGCSSATMSRRFGHRARESGIVVADDAYLDTPITAQLDGATWHPGPIAYIEARQLARHLSTACTVIIAYLSGARPSEVLNLRRGCVEYDTVTGLWLMSGTYFKGATDDDGNKLPAGAPRRDPWVVVEPVATAIGVLQHLHEHPLLFPRSLEPPYQRRHNSKRKGNARPGSESADALAAFTDWVNDYARHRGIPGIPADPGGRLNLSRFRRTLCWFIRRRPRGLVAGAIQYGHVHVGMTQGYAGDYDSGFPDDYAFEDFLARLDELAADEQALLDGEKVSGPAADAYRTRISAAHKQFAGHVLNTGKQARDLLGNPLLQIFHGKGMTCVFDPKQAACQLRGDADDPLVTPDIDDCRPRCPNIARTDRDIAEIRRHREELAVIVADPLAPPIRHRREQHELDRLDTILETHQ